MNTKIILCTGGACSGKSEFAEKLALSKNGKQLYIATSQVFDEEMREKVKLHQLRRENLWDTVEISKNLSKNILSLIKNYDTVLLDCVTMYILSLFNTDMDFNNTEDQAKLTELIETEFIEIIKNIKLTKNKNFIFVSNELGNGIVPIDSMSRLYRNITGKINKILAHNADEVYLTISGITIEIKSKEVKLNG